MGLCGAVCRAGVRIVGCTGRPGPEMELAGANDVGARGGKKGHFLERRSRGRIL